MYGGIARFCLADAFPVQKATGSLDDHASTCLQYTLTGYKSSHPKYWNLLFISLKLRQGCHVGHPRFDSHHGVGRSSFTWFCTLNAAIQCPVFPTEAVTESLILYSRPHLH